MLGAVMGVRREEATEVNDSYSSKLVASGLEFERVVCGWMRMHTLDL